MHACAPELAIAVHARCAASAMTARSQSVRVLLLSRQASAGLATGVGCTPFRHSGRTFCHRPDGEGVHLLFRSNVDVCARRGRAVTPPAYNTSTVCRPCPALV
ncbi:hypothetical protein EON67_07980 [archaeon]|nr:MAG: hypothetical protein EON67_07980 [archaeon]